MPKVSKEGKIIIIQGDITEQDADAIVNAANNELWMGGGVAGAIKRKGGIEIEKEAVEKGPIPVGEVAVTNAGKLKTKYVIHAATMGMDFKTDSQIIRKATHSSLRKAEELQLQSLAFPALGTGVGGFPLKECAQIMLAETRSFLKTSEHLQEVRFVLFDQESCATFRQRYDELRENR